MGVPVGASAWGTISSGRPGMLTLNLPARKVSRSVSTVISKAPSHATGRFIIGIVMQKDKRSASSYVIGGTTICSGGTSNFITSVRPGGA